MNKQSRYRGCLLGLAAGDAVGTAVEFCPRGSFKSLTDMIGGGPFQLMPGQWTDDTSMALCLAESLIESGADPDDQMRRYIRWYRHGHFSSTGNCFDIGISTREALLRYERESQPFCGSPNPRSAGNGSLMRLASIPMYFSSKPMEAIDRAGQSSRTTHGAVECVDACRYFSGLLVGALRGVSKTELLSPRFCPIEGFWKSNALASKVEKIANGSFKNKDADQIRSSGYVIDTLEAALWAFHRSESFEQGCLDVVNLGDDADSTGAVFGQLAGAFYGVEGIPKDWKNKIAKWHKSLGEWQSIEAIADRLLAAADDSMTSE